MAIDSSGPDSGFLKHPLTRRQALQGAAALGAGTALAPALVACGGDEAATSASPGATGPKKGGSLKVGITTGSGKETFDPHNVSYEPEIANAMQLYNRLIEFTPDYQLVNVLHEGVSCRS
ncbi:MAG: hypothetical protein WC709_08255 [Thermoleophilia bacterium]